MPADLIPSVTYTQLIPSCTMAASKALELSEAAYLASSSGGGGVKDWGNLTVNANCCRRYGPSVQTNVSPGPGFCLYEGTIGVCDGTSAAATRIFSSDSAPHTCPAERRTWLLSFPDDEESVFTASHTGSGSFSDPTHWTATATGTFDDGEGGGGSYSLAITGLGNTTSGTFTGTISGALTGTLSGTYGGGTTSTTYVLTDPAPPFPTTVTGTGAFTAGVPPNFTIAGSLTFPARTPWESAHVEFTVDGGSGGTVDVTIGDIGSPSSFVAGATAIKNAIAAFAGWTPAEIDVVPLWNGLTVVTGRPPIARQMQIIFKANFPTSLTPVDFDILDADGNYHSFAVLTGPTITGGGSPVDLYTWVEFAGCDAEEITVECRRDSDDFVYARWTNTGHVMQSGARTVLTLVHEACEGPCGEVRGFAKKVICFEPTIAMNRCSPSGWAVTAARLVYDGEFGGTTGNYQDGAGGTGRSPAQFPYHGYTSGPISSLFARNVYVADVDSTGFTGGPYTLSMGTLTIDDVRNIWSTQGFAYAVRCPNNVTGATSTTNALYSFSATSSWGGRIGSLTVGLTTYDVTAVTFEQSGSVSTSGWPCTALDYVFSSPGSIRVTVTAFPFSFLGTFDATPEVTVEAHPDFHPPYAF